MKFNPEKTKIGCTEVKYLGFIFNHKGVSVDPSKIKSICEMPSPVCVPDIQRFLGMINFLGAFVKNLSKETTHIRQLLNKNVEWSWTDKQESEFNRLKNLISSAPVLTYFDPNKPLTLSVDASSTAMGAVISHGNNPIAYASASLTKAQCNYAQIEKELLAILFGCQKFHQYIYGNRVTVETDHKPIVGIYNKPLFNIPPRLQRILLRLQPYDLNIIYKPGKYLYIADTLSRAALLDNELTDLDEDIELHVNLLTSNLSISPSKLNEIISATSSDETLQKLILYCKNGFPNSKDKVEDCIKPYFPLKDDIHEANNLVFLSNRIIIPSALRKYFLKLIHEGHQGMNSCKKLVRNSMYWPNINNDIDNYISNCDICLTYRNSNPKQNLQPHDIKFLPWHKVAMDFFEFNKKIYLIVVDYFSKFVEVTLLNNGNSAIPVINSLKSIFARHGIPQILVSDNGPPMNSKAFQDFVNAWNIDHITSSPYYPRSNGLVERTIGTIKNMLKKCLADNSDPYLALLQYRNTPKHNLCSPAQLSMSRKLRSKLPVIERELKPKVCNYEQLKQCNDKYIVKSKQYYNKCTKELPPLHVGDRIYFQKYPKAVWSPGVITQIGPEPRSFVIQSNGVLYRRNRQHINKPSLPAYHHYDPPLPSEITSSQGDINRDISAEPSALQQSTIGQKVTRSGRVVKLPERYRDFVL